jgi:cell fate regulator YaaT (PSP1 superfamily)
VETVRRVVGVVFGDGGKVYQFAAGDLELAVGDQVVVDTAKGPNIGRVVRGPEVLDEAAAPPNLKSVVRPADGHDLHRMEENRVVEVEARQACQDLIAELGLQMKLVSVEASFDAGKLLFSFCAEERVDFRELVGKLNERLHRRVELRQVSARDEARIIGGYGPCGRRLCCALFPGNQEPVSIRMAKDQSLPLNPAKISGVCGRLMCCLKYEHAAYTSFRERAPRKGATVSTPSGPGKVVEHLATRDSVAVDLGDGHVSSFTLAELGMGDKETNDEC